MHRTRFATANNFGNNRRWEFACTAYSRFLPFPLNHSHSHEKALHSHSHGNLMGIPNFCTPLGWSTMTGVIDMRGDFKVQRAHMWNTKTCVTEITNGLQAYSSWWLFKSSLAGDGQPQYAAQLVASCCVLCCCVFTACCCIQCLTSCCHPTINMDRHLLTRYSPLSVTDTHTHTHTHIHT